MRLMPELHVPIHRDHRRMLPAAALLLAGGLLIAACSSGSTSSSTTTTGAGGGGSTTTTSGSASGGLGGILNGVSRSSSATYSATYLVVEASTGKSQTITFAQAPPKSAVATSSGSFYFDGTTVTECQGSGSTATCTALPSSMTGLFSSLANLFSPSVITGTLRGVQAAVAADHAGYVVSTSTGTYGGRASNCVTVKGTARPTPVTYCGDASEGVLTYLNANGNTLTLQAYSSSPPASTFAPPAGATVRSIPGGV